MLKFHYEFLKSTRRVYKLILPDDDALHSAYSIYKKYKNFLWILFLLISININIKGEWTIFFGNFFESCELLLMVPRGRSIFHVDSF